MKRIGVLSVAFAAMLSVACGGGQSNDTTHGNDDAAMGTGATPGTEGAAGTAGENANRGGNIGAQSGAQNWVRERLAGNMAEVKLGELASQRAQNADVKAFGRRMVQDHTKSSDELKQLASQQNIQAPAELEDEHRDQMQRLQNLQGAEFDREYMNMMVENHENTLNALEERVNKEGEDRNARYTPKQTDDQFETRLNQWAAKSAPVVQQHLEQARQLNDKIGRRMTDNQ